MTRNLFRRATAEQRPGRVAVAGLGAALSVTVAVTSMTQRSIEPAGARMEDAVEPIAGVTATEEGEAPASAPAPTERVTAATDEAVKGWPNNIGGPELAVALAAAGVHVSPEVTLKDVRSAAATLGVELSDPLDDASVERLRTAAWESARRPMLLAGIGYGDAPDLSDLRESAARYGVEVRDPLTPADAEAVLAAGRADVVAAMRGVRFEFASGQPTYGELKSAAAALGVNYGGKLEWRDVRVTVARAKDVARRAREADQVTPLFGRAGGVNFHMPSHRVTYAGFHESSSPGVMPFKRSDDAPTSVLPSRGRGTPSTSAIDIVQPPGEDVRSPVTGRVVEVTKYALYGKYTDYRLRIVPDDNPGTLVSVLHVVGPNVRVGDRVQGGLTVLADGPRKFPFRSQIDGHAGTDWGHVHIESRPR